MCRRVRTKHEFVGGKSCIYFHICLKKTKKQMFLDITYKENAEEGVLTSSFLCVSFSAGRPGMRDRNSSCELCGSHWTLM